jgi:hypothetical protein
MSSSFNILAGALVLSLCCGALAFSALRQKRKAQQQQQRGISWLSELRLLLSHMQRHRGLSSGYLAGNTELAREIEQIQNKIRRDREAINAIGPWIHTNERWQGIEQHWARLNQGYRTLDIDNSLQQHNKLITNLLYLIEDTAEAHHLRLLDDNSARLSFVWRELLVAAEHIGQARALGTAITASGRCDSVSRIRLAYLENKIRETTEQAWRNLDTPSQTRLQVDALLLCIQEEVMTETPKLSSQAYFEKASQCLEAVLGQFDHEIQAIDARI